MTIAHRPQKATPCHGILSSRMDEETTLAVSPERVHAPSLGVLGAPETHEFIRYFLASGIALAVDVSLLFLLTNILGIGYLYSGALAFAAGLITIYLLSITWVFESRTLKNWKFELVLFAAIGVVGLLLNELFLWFFTEEVGLFYLVSKILSIGVVFSWNFIARKYILFTLHAKP